MSTDSGGPVQKLWGCSSAC